MSRSSIPTVFAALLVVVAGEWSWAAPGPRSFSQRAVLKRSGRFSPALCLAFTDDGKSLVCVSAGRRPLVQTWDIASGEITVTFECDGELGFGAFNYALTPDAKKFAISRGKTIRVWDVADGKRIATLEEDAEVTTLDLTPDGKCLWAEIASVGELRIWDVENKVRVRTRGVSALYPVALHRSTKRPVLLRAGNDDDLNMSLSLLDSYTGQMVARCEFGEKKKMFGEGDGSCYALHPDETILASGGRRGALRLWDMKKGECIAIFKYSPFFPALAFSPNGKTLACGYRNAPGGMVDINDKSIPQNGLLIYEIPSGKILAKVEEKLGIGAVAFSPDGRMLATASGNIRLWDLPESWGEKKNK